MLIMNNKKKRCFQIPQILQKHVFMDILCRKVESDFELKQLVEEELFQSLKNAVEDGEQVSTFVSGVKKLFESDVFIQACAEAHIEDPYLLIELGCRLDAESNERMEALMRDTFFQPILQETLPDAIIRGVLSVVFGYWGDKEKAVTAEQKKIPKPDRGPPVEMVYDNILNIDVSSDTEGLKEALTSRYQNDPNHDYNHICEEDDSNLWSDHLEFPTGLISGFPDSPTGRRLDAECNERMEALMRDTFFQPILQETQPDAIIRCLKQLLQNGRKFPNLIADLQWRWCMMIFRILMSLLTLR
ncbi:unnamed protein product [Cuscuta campestris]|uniref:Uncharacterized protein n=1 Tax=Cuscuta campestris TaxID=132261 RepID=A0A484M6E4_9ASTE|nr:unnamed protein product [Cuscuta campestris]